MEMNVASASENRSLPESRPSPVIPNLAASSPAPVDGLTITPPYAPMVPSAAQRPAIETLGPPLKQSSEAAGPSPQMPRGKNNGGRPKGFGCSIELLQPCRQAKIWV